MSVQDLLDRARHSPFGALLLVGAICSFVQLTVDDLPWWAAWGLYFAGVFGIAVGGGGIGLSLGRSNSEARAAKAEKENAALRRAMDLTNARLVRPFERMIGRFQEILIARASLAERYAELQESVSATGKVEWTRVDKTIELVANDLEYQVRDLDRGISEEWRELLPARVAQLEQPGPPRARENEVR